MKIEKVTYQKVFPIAQFVNEKIGIEVQVDEGESPEEVLSKAKEIVEGWHKEANPVLYLDLGLNKSPLELSSKSSPVYNIAHEKWIIQLEDANTPEELSSLKEGLPNELMPLYLKRMKELK